MSCDQLVFREPKARNVNFSGKCFSAQTSCYEKQSQSSNEVPYSFTQATVYDRGNSKCWGGGAAGGDVKGRPPGRRSGGFLLSPLDLAIAFLVFAQRSGKHVSTCTLHAPRPATKMWRTSNAF